jgi:hypothetical protein
LGKCHDAKLLGAIHTSNAGIPTVAIYYASEAPPGNEIHDLREERLADIHAGQFNRNGRRRQGTLEFEQVSWRRLILQEVGVRHFKSTAHKIDRKASWILGFSDMTNDLTGQQ